MIPLILGAAGTIGTLVSNYFQMKSAQGAGEVQAEAAQAGIDEQRRQFDAMQGLLEPFVQAGQGALEEQQALSGLLGQEAQQQAIQGIESSPEFGAMTRQGEASILANASATGGLRGGNTQGALAQFRPQVLSGLINQRFGQLGGLTGMGQASAAGVGAGGMQTGANIANLLGQQGQAQALSQTAGSQFAAGIPGALTGGLGMFTGMGGFGGSGGINPERAI